MSDDIQRVRSCALRILHDKFYKDDIDRQRALQEARDEVRKDEWIARAVALLQTLEAIPCLENLNLSECAKCVVVDGHDPDCELAKLIEEAKEYIDGE